MPCNAVAYGWAQLNEENLLKLLTPDIIKTVLQKLLEQRSKAVVKVKTIGKMITLEQGTTLITYHMDGKLGVVINKGNDITAARLSEEAIAALKKAALLRLKLAVVNLVRAQGGSIVSAEEAPGATIMKVEVNNGY
jgi:hypothetical protein